MTNGLCLQTQELANRLSRGACTDQTFSSTACPKVCDDIITGNSLTIFLAYDDAANNGAFCCVYPYNSTSAQCQLPTAGSYEPFDIDSFQVIYDRSTGATIPLDGSSPTTTANSSGAAATSTVTTTATATATGTSGTSVAAVAAGVAAPLGVLLLASLIACGILLSRLKKLRREQHPASGTSYMGGGGGGGYGHHAMAPATMPYDYKSVPQEQQSEYGSGWSQAGMLPRPVAPVEVPATMEIGEADSRPITGQKR
ncbi:hypothetical protein LTR02_000371 [Friedmanniomyces endolithicus]|nr:hypothetical protein LTR94_010449 [Friedmanniomyces endolithicus]KAK0792564.1 hypothetical protein LTR75_011444 [Friedmanniomyces endolithicus]KAK0793978.1 hypothetical protein LTR38_009387 [Friedmanniomyces endolithicus]KAK0806262.1 hypothetical protein LTR59_003675 [Friedmanniomyces endolithicus]KAK0839741.1 hypothetical protein LTS02_017399 [Friedmanniomyces endolithicus]